MERASHHVGWILCKGHWSSHIGNINAMDSSGAGLAGHFYSMVHIFFMVSWDNKQYASPKVY